MVAQQRLGQTVQRSARGFQVTFQCPHLLWVKATAKHYVRRLAHEVLNVILHNVGRCLPEALYLFLEAGQRARRRRTQEVRTSMAFDVHRGQRTQIRAPQRLTGTVYPGEMHDVFAGLLERPEAENRLAQRAEGEAQPREVLGGEGDRD